MSFSVLPSPEHVGFPFQTAGGGGAPPATEAAQALQNGMGVATATMTSGFAAAQACLQMSQEAAALQAEWFANLAKCRSPFEAAAVNAECAEKAMRTCMDRTREMIAETQRVVTKG